MNFSSSGSKRICRSRSWLMWKYNLLMFGDLYVRCYTNVFLLRERQEVCPLTKECGRQVSTQLTLSLYHSIQYLSICLPEDRYTLVVFVSRKFEELGSEQGTINGQNNLHSTHASAMTIMYFWIGLYIVGKIWYKMESDSRFDPAWVKGVFCWNLFMDVLLNNRTW